MDLQGIEWALPVFEIVMVIFPIYGFVSFLKRVQRGTLTKGRAFWRYSALVIAPVILYALFFWGLVGFGELAHIHLITELLARTFFIAVGLGIVIWLVSMLVFGGTLLFLKGRT